MQSGDAYVTRNRMSGSPVESPFHHSLCCPLPSMKRRWCIVLPSEVGDRKVSSVSKKEVLLQHRGKAQRFSFSGGVRVPPEVSTGEIVAPLLDAAHQGRNALLILVMTCSEGDADSNYRTSRCTNPSAGMKTTDSRTTLSHNICSFLFQSIFGSEKPLVRTISMVTVSAQERLMYDELQRKGIKHTEEIKYHAVSRENADEMCSQVLSTLQSREHSMVTRSTSMASQTACVVTLGLKGLGDITVVHAGSEQTLLDAMQDSISHSRRSFSSTLLGPSQHKNLFKVIRLSSQQADSHHSEAGLPKPPKYTVMEPPAVAIVTFLHFGLSQKHSMRVLRFGANQSNFDKRFIQQQNLVHSRSPPRNIGKATALNPLKYFRPRSATKRGSPAVMRHGSGHVYGTVAQEVATALQNRFVEAEVKGLAWAPACATKAVSPCRSPSPPMREMWRTPIQMEQISSALLEGCANLRRRLAVILHVTQTRIEEKISSNEVEREDEYLHTLVTFLHLVQEHHYAMDVLEGSLREITLRKFADWPSCGDSRPRGSPYATTDIYRDLEARLGFEAERCWSLKSFAPLYSQLAVSTEYLIQQCYVAVNPA